MLSFSSSAAGTAEGPASAAIRRKSADNLSICTQFSVCWLKLSSARLHVPVASCTLGEVVNHAGISHHSAPCAPGLVRLCLQHGGTRRSDRLPTGRGRGP